MTVNAQVLMTLLLYNIRTMSHTSSIPIDTTCLLYYIFNERHVDVARVIYMEIRMISSSGHRFGTRTSTTLAFPGLIIGLCGRVGVAIYLLVHGTIEGVLQTREPHVDHPLPTKYEFSSFVDWPGDRIFHFVGEVGGSNFGHTGNAEDESSGETIGLE
ncbi:hypothetical protein KIW84_054547 [Lathyrus oleraceus]|uniref:Putative plant transposon protein domain-containing protein n=1 Tax=Pisum sativum TaxID=3888 RepID=A0A9D4WW41_PEA|nr:hypothetical protein KIW84_054547 [Pisum sativum]